MESKLKRVSQVVKSGSDALLDRNDSDQSGSENEGDSDSEASSSDEEDGISSLADFLLEFYNGLTP